MNQKITKLINLYKDNKKNNPNKYLFDNRVILKSEDIELDGYIITVDYVKANNEYMIFISIGNDDELLFSDVYLNSNQDIISKYDEFVNELFNESLDEIIEKIYKKIF